MSDCLFFVFLMIGISIFTKNFEIKPIKSKICNLHSFEKKFEVESYDTFLKKRSELYPDVTECGPWEPLYHSLKKCTTFKRIYELENNFEYDMVIKSRLDCFYQPGTVFTTYNAEPYKAYSTRPIVRMVQEFMSNNFDEAIFFSDSKTMDLISNVGDLYMQKRSRDYQKSKDNFDIMIESYYGPGAQMYENLMEMNIQPTYHYQPFFYYVARQTHLNLGLDINRNFEEVVNVCNKWYL